MDTKRNIAVLKFTKEGVEGTVDEVVSELPVRLILNGAPLVTLLCTPAEIEELAIGFLLSEGLLRHRASLGQITVEEHEPAVHITLKDCPADMDNLFEKRTISSGCGSGISYTTFNFRGLDRMRASSPVVSTETISELLRTFRDASTLYLETGGAHSAALSDGRSIVLFAEDIGRHNAVDKLLGKAFLKQIQVDNMILLTSGRVTSEILTKAGRNRIPVVISRAAPSCMAVSMAEDMGITLIGFARGDRMNVYSWPSRVARHPAKREGMKSEAE